MLIISFSYLNTYGENSNLYIRDIISSSTRDFNSTIIYWINNYDLETTNIIAESLLKRKDLYIGDIISNLAFDYTNQNKYIKEYELTIILNKFFNFKNKSINLRVESNYSTLITLLDNFQNFKNPLLRVFLIKLLSRLKYRRGKKILMLMSQSLISQLRGNFYSPELNLEISTFLTTVYYMPDKILIEPVIMISRLSTDSTITEKSRKLLDFLSVLN